MAASASAAGVAEKPRAATRSMTALRTASSSPGLTQTLAVAVGRFTLILSTPSIRPTTRSMREEQAAQCMPPISKRRGQAPSALPFSFSAVMAAPPDLFFQRPRRSLNRLKLKMKTKSIWRII